MTGVASRASVSPRDALNPTAASRLAASSNSRPVTFGTFALPGTTPDGKINENGVFRPIERVDLPEKSEVIFEPRVVQTDKAPTPAMGRIYEILSRRYDTGETDLADRHNEHQP